jgi:hypothetical protein
MISGKNINIVQTKSSLHVTGSLKLYWSLWAYKWVCEVDVQENHKGLEYAYDLKEGQIYRF